MSFFELPPGLYEEFRLHANRLRDVDQVRLVRLEESEERRKQRRLSSPQPQLLSPDSGQFDEPLRPTLAPKRCRKCGQGKYHWVIVVGALQRVRTRLKGNREATWPRS